LNAEKKFPPIRKRASVSPVNSAISFSVPTRLRRTVQLKILSSCATANPRVALPNGCGVRWRRVDPAVVASVGIACGNSRGTDENDGGPNSVDPEIGFTWPAESNIIVKGNVASNGFVTHSAGA
jgi:hypothetical protein